MLKSHLNHNPHAFGSKAGGTMSYGERGMGERGGVRIREAKRALHAPGLIVIKQPSSKEEP